MSAMDERGSLRSYRVLVTGGNAGLGFAICTRLIDEFLSTRSPSETLVLIITTRSKRKADGALNKLRVYLHNAAARIAKQESIFVDRVEPRVQFQAEILDLCSIVSVQNAARSLLGKLPSLDVVILNAGIGGWIGVDWLNAVWSLMTSWAYSITYPTFKIQEIGGLVKSQLPLPAGGQSNSGSEQKVLSNERQEPPLGEIFCANVFGHYLLTHYLMPLLWAHGGGTRGRVVWVSSLEAADLEAPDGQMDTYLNFDDFQGLKSPTAYERTKRITDILALTADIPTTAPWTQHYYSPDENERPPAVRVPKPRGNGTHAIDDPARTTSRPKTYVVHPGICSTGIFPLPYLLVILMDCAFYIARWLGSIWHTCTPYKGAVAPVWVALADQGILDEMEEREGKAKWGSSTDWYGNERVVRTEVLGWGYGGVVGDAKGRTRGRRREAKDLTKEVKEDFEGLGRECWKRMEELRHDWEDRVGDAALAR